ncbi:hypothetical protein A0H81_03749 [Grifola frondosa]|uniref:Serine-threonine/tyrosine-protein kinase catalytic domain-containing protein n=1 Tax=Grifola frondosa TaxID=5627 RepID=A0A1C7MIL3_GRIFR|nr:hypothetical protein A0H81_03749 [Grifola frondosa]
MDASTKADLLPDLPEREIFEAQWYLTAPRHAFEAQRFWTAYRPWLSERGYTLFDLIIEQQDGVPFWSLHQPQSLRLYLTPSITAMRMHRLFHGKYYGHRLVLLMGKTPSVETSRSKLSSRNQRKNIYNHLLQCCELSCTETFANVLPPLHVLRIPHQLSFVVMPMWGDRLLLGDIKTAREVIDFIIDLLRGLMFLHEQRIAHRDIAETNVMVNYFSAIPFKDDGLGPLWRNIERRPKLEFLFDYNLSIHFLWNAHRELSLALNRSIQRMGWLPSS